MRPKNWHTPFKLRKIDYFNGTPTNKSTEAKMSEKAEEMLRFDLENERQTLINYRQRIRQADAMGEFALGEVLRKILNKNRNICRTCPTLSGLTHPKSNRWRKLQRRPGWWPCLIVLRARLPTTPDESLLYSSRRLES